MKSLDSGLGPQPEFKANADPGVTAGSFVLTGEFWLIGYGGVNCTLRNSLGLGYVQRLLQHPSEEFGAQQLLAGPVTPVMPAGLDENALRNEGFIPRPLNDLGPVIDQRGKQDFRRRLHELSDELEDLRERGAHDRAEKVQIEIESIQRELIRAHGLGGRDRRLGSAAERARINVTRAIHAAIQRVGEHHGPLGKLLDESIRTGSFCRYLPKVRVAWKFAADPIFASSVTPAPLPPVVAPDPHSALELPLTPRDQAAFVGRAEERALIRDCLRRAMNGESGIVMISGPAGIGKTRLSREIGADARSLGFVTFAGNCYDREESVPYIPFVEAFESSLAQATSLAGFREDVGEEAAAEIARLMPQLRRLFPDIPPPLQGSPEQARRALFNAAVDMIARLSRRDPFLLLLEDVHWADEGTLALLAHLARGMTGLRLVVMLTYRDDAIDPAGPFSQTLDELLRRRAEQIRLPGLPQTAVAEMIETLSGRQPLATLVHLLYANTEGNPLYVVELVRHLERNAAERPSPEALDPAELDLPPSLRLVIGRRLARVNKATQQMLGTAAVIGRSFTFALLEAATGIDADALVELVEEAEKAGLISSRLRYPDAQFKFAHELLRRAVLDELSIARRQRLHLGVARALEQLHASALEDQAEDLAYHLWNAGAAAEAGNTIRYLQIAGTHAVQTAANAQAIGHFKKALRLVNSAPDSPERVQTELMLQVALSVPLFTMKGYASPDVEVVFARARHLCAQAGDSPQLFPVLWLRCLFHTARAECMTARDLAGQCLRLAEKVGDPVLLLLAHHMLGVSLSSLADFGPALEHFDQTIRLYDPEQHAGLTAQYGHDFGVVARAQAALDLWFLGYPERALAMTEEALGLARKLSHPLSLIVVLNYATRVHAESRDTAATQERAEEVLKLAGDSEFGFWRPVANICHGWALAQGSATAEGIAEIRAGLDAYRASGAQVGRPTFLAFLGEALGRSGQAAAGLEALSEAFATVTQSGERWSEPELYRIEGELTLMLAGNERPLATHRKKAEDCFLRAIEIAQDQKAKMLELRATVSLYRLWAGQDKRAEARRRLEEIYGWFTEGFDTRDVIEAAQLIASNT